MTTGLATAVVLPIAPAKAQFFFGFSAPQQIQTSRGAIQLAPGWHVATSPVRTNNGYRVAVRSETGEQRQMLIGANGALSYGRAPDPRVRRRRCCGKWNGRRARPTGNNPASRPPISRPR